MTLREKTVNIGLGITVFDTVSRVAEEDVVAETFQIAVFDSEKSHQCFVGLDTGDISEGAEKGILLSQ